MSELGSFLARGAARALARMPLRVAHALGAAAGWLPYLVRSKFKRRIDSNLRQAALTQDEAAFARLRRAVVTQQGRAAFELPMMWLRPSSELMRLVREVEGMEHIDKARADGRGIIFVTPHLGNFEMAGRYVSTLMPVTFLYRPPRVAWLEPIMNAGRAREGARMAPANTQGVRMMFKALKSGGAIGVLPDQAPGAGEGVWADFFGRPAYTMTLIARLQQATGASVIPFFAQRLSYSHGYKIVVSAPIYLQGYTPREAATCLNRAIEALVLRCPEQYLWSYNRYKIPADVAPPLGATGHTAPHDTAKAHELALPLAKPIHSGAAARSP